MTHDGLREADGGAGVMDAVECGRRQGSRLSTRDASVTGIVVADRPTAAVMVVPLWDRPRVGVCR